MTSTKTIAAAPPKPAVPAVPVAPVAPVAPANSATPKVAAMPATAKRPAAPITKQAAKSAPRKVAAKKAVTKTPAPKALTNITTPKTAPTGKTAQSKTVKIEKLKKPKLVRDSFTIPKLEYLVLEALKQRAGKLSRSVKKSELLRAGIKVLAALSDAAYVTALDKVPAIKTGRPASGK